MYYHINKTAFWSFETFVNFIRLDKIFYAGIRINALEETDANNQ